VLQQLQVGNIHDLYTVFGGLGSGRLVIAGPPGSGKSGAAVLLVLAALKHRESIPAKDRSQVPVPMIFTLHGWDPGTLRVQDWLATQLRQTYPLFARKDGVEKAVALLAAGKVAVVLDGFDEIPEELRPGALRALSQQATFRLIILTRSDEMAAAAAHGSLDGAAAIEFQDVDPATAADYLMRVQRDPAPKGWKELTSRLRRNPGSPISQALSSPLTLTLVRDTYRGGDDVKELLDFCDAANRHASRDHIANHLLDRVLPAAYVQRPGESPLRYDLQTAQHALRCIAARMNRDGSRDLLWWWIRVWAPSAPQVITTALIFGLTGGLAFGLAFGLKFGVVFAVMSGLALGVPLPGFRLRLAPVSWHQTFGPWMLIDCVLVSGLPFGLAAGLAVGLKSGLTSGIAAGLTSGIAAALALALASGFVGVGGLRPDAYNASPLSPLASWRGNRSSALAGGLALGAAFGLAFGLTFGLAGGPAVGLAFGLAAALTFGFLIWSLRGVAFGLGSGIMVGLAFGLTFGLAGGPAAGLRSGLTFGLTTGIALGLAVGFMHANTWAASFTFFQLAVLWRTPVRLMRFLEDARARGVLRSVGPVYQFRHARLQDRLAEHAVVTGKGLMKPQEKAGSQTPS
jgi:hypothetical protein